MADAYEVVTGGLKLKGAGGVKKKKKKSKKKAEEIVEQASTSADRGEEQQYQGNEETNKTPAEIAFEKMQEKRAAERIMKKATKTHKQRVEELNQYLDGLTEHYDIQKVSWTK